MAEQDKAVSYAGYVQCFCNAKALEGDAPDTEYKGVKICQEYIES